jgi:hypothetical protein
MPVITGIAFLCFITIATHIFLFKSITFSIFIRTQLLRFYHNAILNLPET